MAVHAFQVGDIVSLRLRAAAAAGEAYEVTRLLRVESRGPIYGIKSIGDSHERTAREHDLIAMKIVSHLNVLPQGLRAVNRS